MKDYVVKFGPANTVLLSFLAVIIVGAVLLCLPAAAIEKPIPFIDAFFLSTSAVCVTGLSTLHLGKELTHFGHVVILLLIQIGGLGIMTYSLFFFLLLRAKTSLASRLALSGIASKTETQSLLHTLKFVLLMTFSFEGLGALCLYLRFREIYPPQEAIFLAIFHSVSAFCNAGLTLFDNSIVHFQHETFVPTVIMVLIIFGGLGFMVIDEMRLWFFSKLKKNKFRLSLHARIALIGTAILIVGGAGMILFLENKNLLAGMPWWNQWINALFLSVTSRTAGFNTIEIGSLTDATLFFVIMLMFIGGCPGSTAGGVKVSTFAVLLALIKDQIRGINMASLFKRKIPGVIVAKSLAIFASAFILINFSALVLQITERMGVAHGTSKGSFLDLLFEAVSAFGTVGLSTGITSILSVAGKVLIIVLMFVGRVGPLTLGLAILAKRREQNQFEYAEEEIMVG